MPVAWRPPWSPAVIIEGHLQLGWRDPRPDHGPDHVRRCHPADRRGTGAPARSPRPYGAHHPAQRETRRDVPRRVSCIKDCGSGLSGRLQPSPPSSSRALAAAASSASSSQSIASGVDTSACSRTSLTWETGMIVSPSFTLSGISGRSFSLSLRDQHRGDPAAQRRQKLFLQPADGQHVAPSVTSPVMAMSLRTGVWVRTETMEVTMAMPALGPSLGVAPSGTWTWMSHGSSRGGFTPIRRDGAHVGRRRVDRLLHHVAELAGGLHPALARQAQRLDRQQVPADGGPGQAGHDADLILKLGQAVLVAAHAQHVLQRVGRDLDGLDLLLEDLRQALPRELGQLPLEVPHARLAGVVADRVGQRLVVSENSLAFSPWFFTCLGRGAASRSRASRPRCSPPAG
jgi:hypothetical protein